jgi:hypothetical protein
MARRLLARREARPTSGTRNERRHQIPLRAGISKALRGRRFYSPAIPPDLHRPADCPHRGTRLWVALLVRHRVDLVAAAVAGLLLGFATAVKLTDGPIAVSLVVIVALRNGGSRGRGRGVGRGLFAVPPNNDGTSFSEASKEVRAP